MVHVATKVMTGKVQILGDLIDIDAVRSMHTSSLKRPHANIKSSLRRLSY